MDLNYETYLREKRADSRSFMKIFSALLPRFEVFSLTPAIIMTNLWVESRSSTLTCYWLNQLMAFIPRKCPISRRLAETIAHCWFFHICPPHDSPKKVPTFEIHLNTLSKWNLRISVQNCAILETDLCLKKYLLALSQNILWIFSPWTKKILYGALSWVKLLFETLSLSVILIEK